jgi:hypothetical protein
MTSSQTLRITAAGSRALWSAAVLFILSFEGPPLLRWNERDLLDRIAAVPRLTSQRREPACGRQANSRTPKTHLAPATPKSSRNVELVEWQIHYGLEETGLAFLSSWRPSWQRVNLEFEFESRDFRDHGHPLTGCDVIVCWHHNWPDCPAHIEVQHAIVLSAIPSQVLRMGLHISGVPVVSVPVFVAYQVSELSRSSNLISRVSRMKSSASIAAAP